MSTAQKVIPSGWEVKKIKDLLDFEQPDNYIVKSTNYTDSGKTPVLTANKSFVLGYTDENFGICENLPVIIFDDFTTDSKYVDFPFKIKSSAIKILRSKDKNLDLKFIYEIMKSINFPIANHRRYYISQYQEMDVAIPPGAEQRDIGEILEALDKNIEKTDEVVVATEKLKRGLMQQLFIRGIGHTKFKNTKLGEIPEDWKVLRLKDIAKYRRGSFPQPYGLSKWYDDIDGAPFAQVFDVGEDMKLKDKTKRKISKAAQEMSVFVKKGSLILTIQGSIGRVAITQYDTYLDRTLLLFESFLVPIDLPFFSYAMSILFNREKEKAPGGIIKTITKEALSSFLVPTPDLPEQKRISDILSSVDEKISANQKLGIKLRSLKRGLMQDLLSGEKRIV